MNNRVGRGFSLVEGHPNVIEPGKRTMHTLNAYMVFSDDKPYMIGGTPGGDRQPQWNVQVITSVIDYGMDPMEALSAPRWVSMPGTDPASIDDPMVLHVGHGMEPEEIEKLRAKGHALTVLPAGASAGSSKLIMVDPDTGVRMGGVDPRSDGQAVVV